MKVRLFSLPLLGLCALALLAGSLWPTPLAQARQSGDILRLHIVAHSDSEADQRQKLAVRDAILAEYGADLQNCTGKQQAADLFAKDPARLARTVRTAWAGDYRMEVGTFAFPTRWYGGECLPAGDYFALRLVLGQGAGQNWWCVLYPPLCVAQEKPVFRSWLWDAITHLLQQRRDAA